MIVSMSREEACLRMKFVPTIRRYDVGSYAVLRNGGQIAPNTPDDIVGKMTVHLDRDMAVLEAKAMSRVDPRSVAFQVTTNGIQWMRLTDEPTSLRFDACRRLRISPNVTVCPRTLGSEDGS